ncbi:HAMP domain-containing sensor histidine kinase [Knoellia locipacati]|uniref:histidine kinase n=1 Tax=Knoellia locipacati TaxID=882824 RepID=A0A512SXF3_9MICO|nr:HAMP domain-containing sensor histidine kinase [Knoellia locipacati]GEQ12621.1 two-component sensor histidine kinase [Knoellia locipacati]
MTDSRKWRSLRRQLVLATLGVTAVGVVVLTAVFHLVLEDLGRGDVDRVLATRSDAVVRAVEAERGDPLTVPAGVLDAGEVVYDARGERVAGTPLRGLDDAYLRLAAKGGPAATRVGESASLRAAPVTTDGGRGMVVVGVSLRPYETGEGYALALSVASGLLVVAFSGLVASWVARRALRPVGEMAATAASWSEHDLGRRFDLGPPTTELTALGATLDGLLDQVATAIRAEQRLTAELAHELRTPLTTLQGLTDLTLLRDDLTPPVRRQLEDVATTARSMGQTVTTLLHVARTESATASSASLRDVVAAAVDAVGELEGSAEGSGGGAGEGSGEAPAIRVDVGDHRLGIPHDVAVRALVPVLDNAVVHAGSAIRVTSGAAQRGFVCVVVEDDGGGVATDLDIFEPGVSTRGTGLGLALARRVARSAGGDVTLTSRSEPTRFEVRLPLG